jgi:hypothetical protein
MPDILCATGPFLRCGICISNQSLIGKAAVAAVEDWVHQIHAAGGVSGFTTMVIMFVG